MVAAARTITIHRGVAEAAEDVVAVEEPLEIQIDGRALAVLMRSPDEAGEDDVDLVYGFLLTEGIVSSAADIVEVVPCSVAPSPEAEGNVVRARLRDGVVVDWQRLQRHTFASSSCGVCGKASIENACRVAAPISCDVVFSRARIAQLATTLRERQPTFARTGGVHGALLVCGDDVVVREDVGRHNAVDKVIGHALRTQKTPSQLIVSGRISFELVQKALAARIPLIAGVGAPTSLALELGAAAGVCVTGFVRGDAMNVYTHAERVA